MDRVAREKRNHRIGGITSVVVHILFLLIAFFLVTCWKSPGPPNRLEDIGVELTFGMDDTGSGEEPIEAEPTPEITEESDEPEGEPQPETATPEPTTEQSDVDTDVTTAEDSPVTSAPETSDAEPVVEPQPDPQPETQPEQEVEDPDPEAEPNPNTMAGSPQSASQGESEDEPGQQGDPESLNQSAMMSGDPGGGTNGEDGSDGNFNVSIGGGWKWNKEPEEKRIKHSGSITFSFVVDEFGEITRIKILQSSFTPAEENMLRQKIMDELTFRRSSSAAPPEETQGKLTWKFKAQ